MVVPIRDGCPSSRLTATGKRLSGLILVRRLSDEQRNLHINRLSGERPDLHIRHLERLIIVIDTVRQLHRRTDHVNRLIIILRRMHIALMSIAQRHQHRAAAEVICHLRQRDPTVARLTPALLVSRRRLIHQVISRIVVTTIAGITISFGEEVVPVPG